MTNNDFNLDVISISSTDSVFVKNNIKHTNSVPNFDSNIAKSSADDVANINIETENQNADALNIKHDLDDKSDNCSYHSSDFEFITEEEANIEGLIINFRPKTVNNVKQPEKANLNASSHFSRFYLPGTSQYDNNFNYRENHAIPEGDDYLNLFQGIFAPALTPLHLLENKSFRSTRMNVQFEGIGFDMKVLNKKNMEDQKDVAFKEEAEECARKILEMYPEDNRKRRRQF
ncbi:uncharacterized protein LOC113515267 [Galleria mellonella]|uniref:Uncharacterized protein LOC113515267 n=1 Tax=Galleria mellonella TaxID=7137 RepID=A0A6J1WKK3_GALME|nr:uncharacterized protein LOC113515267 [Galleria mellonella]